MPSLPATKPQPVAKDKAPETSVTATSELGEALRYEDKLQASGDGLVPVAETATVSDKAVEDMASLVKALQARLDQLEGRQNESYADDDKLFIAKSAGEQWSERRLDKASKSYVDVQMQATAFFGPFNTPEAIAAYLNAKKGKRAGDYMEWEDVRIVTGREKRKIEAQERADREDQGLVPKIPQYFGAR